MDIYIADVHCMYSMDAFLEGDDKFNFCTAVCSKMAGGNTQHFSWAIPCPTFSLMFALHPM